MNLVLVIRLVYFVTIIRESIKFSRNKNVNSPYCLYETQEFRCDTAIPKLVETANAIGVPNISLFVKVEAVPVVPFAPLDPVLALFAVLAADWQLYLLI